MLDQGSGFWSHINRPATNSNRITSSIMATELNRNESMAISMDQETASLTSSEPSSGRVAAFISLPIIADPAEAVAGYSYQLLSWKVSDGVPVREGDTVALAFKKSPHGSLTVNGSHVPQQQQQQPLAPTLKRPTRRRIGGLPPAAPSTASTSQSAVHGSETTSPTEHQSTQASPLERPSHHVPIVAMADGILRIGTNGTVNDAVSGAPIIGRIEVCLHPASLGSLCIICGQQVQQDSNDDGSDQPSLLAAVARHRVQLQKEAAQAAAEKQAPSGSTQVTISGLTVTVSQAESKRLAEQDAVRLRRQKKLSLVLDLDHTLVHATADQRAGKFVTERDDVRHLVLPVEEGMPSQLYPQPGLAPRRPPPGTVIGWMHHFVKIRPHTKEFFDTILPLYEVGVYTAGTRDYAEQIAILLARHIVGARLDQVALEELRHRFAQAQALCGNSNAQPVDVGPPVIQTSAESTSGEAAIQSSVGESKNEGSEQNTDEMQIDAVEDSEGALNPSRKRKRVMFGELPPKREKPDPTIAVEALRQELEQANALEHQAQELRQRMFGSRVVSRTDVGDLGRDVKSLKRIFPCGGTMAAVVDDREDVWANAEDAKETVVRPGEPPENLLVVRPYHWAPFAGFADVNNASAVDLAGDNNAVAAASDGTPAGEMDEQLHWTTEVLRRLHARFYDDDSPGHAESRTVPNILRHMRSEVLDGVKVVLSGLVPLHVQQQQDQSQKSDLPRPTFVRYAENLGATVLPSVDNTATHVVAAKDGTDKILLARKSYPKCAVVSPSWLMECVWSLQHRPEDRHLLSLQKSKRASSPPEAATPPSEIAVTSDNSSNGTAAAGGFEGLHDPDVADEDDDWAADFENELMQDASDDEDELI
jgi:RNA polymerase II subunit A C-terminal domain phosphatase